MPANLNALIRYKQIDLCLRNKYLKATIKVMQEKCSGQLAEYRGVYKLVSERTIRDDIRVMRSGALGFNAPILVKDGVYSYEDKDYSIFNTPVTEMDLLKKIFKMLIRESSVINDPDLQTILERLSDLTGIEIEKPEREAPQFIENRTLSNEYFSIEDSSGKEPETDINFIKETRKSRLFLWESIFEVL